MSRLPFSASRRKPVNKHRMSLKDCDGQVFHNVSNVRRHQSEAARAILTSGKCASQAGKSSLNGLKPAHLTVCESIWLQINALDCFDSHLRELEIAAAICPKGIAGAMDGHTPHINNMPGQVFIQATANCPSNYNRPPASHVRQIPT